MNTKTLERAIAYAIDEAHEIYSEIDEKDREWFYSYVIDRLQSALDELPF